MSAKVKPNPYGGRGWIGYCSEHSETIAGPMTAVDLWADVHNEQHHSEAPVNVGADDTIERESEVAE